MNKRYNRVCACSRWEVIGVRHTLFFFSPLRIVLVGCLDLMVVWEKWFELLAV
jgi:hypothetical protein